MRKAGTVLAAVLLLSLGACSDSISEPTLDGAYAAIRIYGFVHAPDGSPVAGVPIRLEARVVANCSAVRDRATAVTDASGRYAAILGNWGHAFDACLRLWAEPVGDAIVASDSTTRASVRVGGAWADSLRIDFVLPPSA